MKHIVSVDGIPSGESCFSLGIPCRFRKFPYCSLFEEPVNKNQKCTECLKSEKAKSLKITAQAGMVDIDSKGELAYGNIRGMYISGAGHGLQLSERVEHRREEIVKVCSRIAEGIYELEDILK